MLGKCAKLNRKSRAKISVVAILYSRKFSSAKNFVKSDRQAVRQEFQKPVVARCSLLVKNISQEFNLVKKLL